MQKLCPIKTTCGEFQAAIRYDPTENLYFVSIPAFPGTLTEARTLTEAKQYAKEVVTLHVLEHSHAN